MKRALKIIFKSFKILLAVLLVLYIVLFAYISLNKKSIINQVTDGISKKINGHASIGNVELSFFRNFPNISVQLENVKITDSMYAQHNHVFFNAEQVFVRLSIMKLLKKESPLNGITIEKGAFYLYTDTSGYSNKYLFSQKKDSTLPANNNNSNELQLVMLKKISFIIDDRQKEKLHNLFVNELHIKLGYTEAAVLFNTEADIDIHNMAFNIPKGSYVKEKRFTGDFSFRFNKQLNQLQFDSIDIKLSGHSYNLTARFDLSGDSPQFILRAHTKNILYSEGKSLVPEKIAKSLSMVELDKPLDVDASLSGPLKSGEPLIYVKWKAKGTQLKTPFLDFDNASFGGYFTNEVVPGQPRYDPNSIINLDNFSAEWNDMPVTSRNIEILNLSEPVLTCDLRSEFPLEKLNSLINSDVLQLTSGNGSVNIDYKGPLERNNNTNSLINGSVSFKNGKILYAPRNVEMKDLSAMLSFKNSDVMVENLQCNVLNNKIFMQGQAKNLLTLINTEPGKATIDWNITSPSLNLGSFIYLLKPGKKIAASPKRKHALALAASKIDDVLEKASLHVKLNATSLFYKKFTAANVNADVTLLEDKYIINNVSMVHGGGNINLAGSLIKQKANYLQAAFNTSLNNVDVKKVFEAFDNFGQDGIAAQNLEGKLTSVITGSLGLDENGKVLPAGVEAIVNFSLKDGALNNYEPIKKMQNILFKNRDFENIRFAELKDRLEIHGPEIKINRMEIQSTVLSFFVEGIYNTQKNTDISIQVPLNNLKKRGADYNPENIGTDKKGGKSIFLRGRPGSDGKVNFKIDLFNKYKKEKKA